MTDWIKDVSSALSHYRIVEIENTDLYLQAEWLANVAPSDVAQLEPLMKHAYTTPSMWNYYQEIIEDKRCNILLFTLRVKETNEIIATRSVGEAAWGKEYWDEHAPLIGQPVPLAGMAFTVKEAYRKKGIGRVFWQETMSWIKQHTKIKALFGDTNSRRAIEMYLKRGAWFHAADMQLASEFYQAGNIIDLLQKTESLERLHLKLVNRYVWPFSVEVQDKLISLGYKPS